MTIKWPVVPLGDVCDLHTGGTPSTKVLEYYERGEIPWLVSGDVNKVEIFECDGRITDLGLKSSNARLLPKDSVMIALAGQGKTRGTVAMLRMIASCNQSLVAMVPKNLGVLLPEFLFWNLHSRYVEIRRMSGDDEKDRRGLNMQMIRSVEIPLPPLDEQKRIVAKLDEVQSCETRISANTLSIAKSHEALTLNVLRETYEKQASAEDWPSVKFTDFAKHSLGKMLDKKKNQGEFRPYIRNANVQWFSVNTEDIQQMRITEKEGDRYLVKRGDLLICEGGYPGRCAIWDQDDVMYFQKAVHRVRFETTDLAGWVMYFLRFLDLTGRLPDYFSGTGIQHFTGEALARLQVPLPCREIREAHVQKFNDLRASQNGIYVRLQAKQEALNQFVRATRTNVLSGAV